MRELTFVEAIRDTTAHIMAGDDRVILIGEGVPDPKAVFGTTKGLKEKFPDRVFDMPVSENGGTGICIGAAINGLKPIMVHQRIDFTLYAMDQIVNNAAKWHSMFGGRAGHVPLVIRAIIGRGWGQGNQHSQNLTGIYSSIPGLKVVTPSSAENASGLLRAACADHSPIMFLEHRWLHNTKSNFGNDPFTPLGVARTINKEAPYDPHVTIVSWSYMTVEALKAQEFLHKAKIYVDVVDLQTIRPIDWEAIYRSVAKTNKLLIVDESWRFNSLSGEIIAKLAEDKEVHLTENPVRLTLPDFYAPSTHYLTKNFYPKASDIVREVIGLVGKERKKYDKCLDKILNYEAERKHDVPDESFMGPF